MIRHGEVRWYRFRSPDKRRPVVVLTRQSALDFLDDVIVAPITSTVRGSPTEVLLNEGDGMPHDCVVNLDHLHTIPKDALGSVIAILPWHRMEEIRDALLFAVGFE